MASIDVLCMACDGPDCNHRPVMLKRRAPGDDDVVIAMKYCGICHTDLHGAKGDLDGLVGRDHYPNVAGHELSGVCTAVGKNVTKFKVGSYVGVGCMVDSCGTCKNCKAGTEQLCTKQTGTYNARDNGSGRSSAFPPKSHTLGGYTTTFVVYHKFAILIPQTYPLEMAGPVMCAGVTLYSPLREYGAKEGTKVAIVGLGGLGSIGVQIARALGCEVTAISSTNKKEELAKSLGAGAYLVSSDFKEMGEAKGKFDLVLNTIPSEHDYSVYTPLCKKGGKHVVLGINSAFVAGMIGGGMCGGRLRASAIGSIAATQEVIDLCDKHNIRPVVKVIGVTGINEAYEKLDGKNESGERHVIDLSTLNDSAAAACAQVPAPKLTKPDGGLTMGRIISALATYFCCCRCCQ